MLVLPLKLVFEVLQKRVIEIFAAQVSITSRGLDSEYTATDVQKRDIKRSSPQIENQNVLLCL